MTIYEKKLKDRVTVSDDAIDFHVCMLLFDCEVGKFSWRVLTDVRHSESHGSSKSRNGASQMSVIVLDAGCVMVHKNPPHVEQMTHHSRGSRGGSYK